MNSTGKVDAFDHPSCYRYRKMIAVVQRVAEASVTVEGVDRNQRIDVGICVLLGVEQGDGEEEAKWIAGKLARLRIFRDDQNKMNLSVQDVGGEVMVVSQFTLAGDCAKGNRPSFVHAADPALGERLYEYVCDRIAGEYGLPVKRGVFGAMMQVSLINDGPVTLIVRRESGS